MASEYKDRKRLTFEQAEGAEPLPAQLKLREVSPELRARLWAIFHQELANSREAFESDAYATLDGALVSLLYDWHVTRRFRAADEFRPRYGDQLAELKSLFMEGDYLVWRDEAAMRSFMLSGAHHRIMARLLEWCDEVALAHWVQDANEPPSWPIGGPTPVRDPRAADDRTITVQVTSHRRGRVR
jgi:hypothetical protein